MTVAPKARSFGYLLRRYRLAALLTQEQLAERAHLSYRTISELERGTKHTPRGDTVLLLADALELSSQERATLIAAAHPLERSQPTELLADQGPAALSVHTFLIADLRDYTRFTDEHGDEAAARLAARFADVANEVVRPFGGQVIELRGDEALVVFSSARQALRAALELQDRFAAERKANPALPLHVRIGLDAGEAIPLEGGYRGGALNLAARLCSLATAGEVLASEGVIHLARKMDGVVYLDRGEASLKGLARPVRAIQVVAEGAEPADIPRFTIPGRPHTNLPLQPTPFIGREHQLEEVGAMVLREDIRLLTLTGAGGTGKTRLALQVAERLLETFPDGVYFVSLAPLADPALVVSTIAATLDLQEAAGRPILETLAEFLKDRRLLLVLDNFEHLLPAAQEVHQLLSRCAGLKFLVTSRARLHLSAEHEYPVPPLALPDLRHLPELGALSQYDAVSLFIQRAQAVKPSFAVTNENAPAVAEICSRLDGLPLAIELAAARLKLFPPQALLVRLQHRLPLLTGGAKDLPARQQTLRAAIDWSYSLLCGEEQGLFARLSVFAGGCTLEAAERVCDGSGAVDLLDGVTSLVENSLLCLEGEDEPCFVMLETIREYAAERLEESGEGERLRRQHAEYYLQQVEQAEAALSEPNRAEWLDRLEADQNNLRAVLQWALDGKEGEFGIRLALALVPFWLVRGPLSEGRKWLHGFLSDEEGIPPDLRAAAWYLSGELAFTQGSYGDAAGLFERSLALFQDLGDRRGAVEAAGRLAVSLTHRGSIQQAPALLEESISAARALGDKELLAASLRQLAAVATEQGDFVRALELGEESLALYRELGDIRSQAGTLRNLVIAAHWEGDLKRAQAFSEETVQLLKQLSMNVDTRGWMEGLAYQAALQGNYVSAERLLEDLVARSLETGNRRDAAHAHVLLAVMLREQGQLGRAAVLCQEALAVFREVEDMWGIGRALVCLGEVARDQGDAERTNTFCQEALALFRKVGDKAGCAYCLHSLGVAARQQGDYEQAQPLLGESLTLFQDLKYAEDAAEVLTSLGLLGLEQGHHERAEGLFAESLRLGGAGGMRWVVAANLEGMAAVAVQRGQAERAARLLGAAAALRIAFGTPRVAANSAFYEQHTRGASSVLGEERFREAWEDGQAMSVEQCIAYALEEERRF